MQTLPQCENCERTRAQLERIEAKLDALIAALAAEEEGDSPTHDLEGNVLYGNRTEGQPL